MEKRFTEEDMDRMIEAWHRHTMALTALVINLTTLIDHAGIEFDAETVEVLENNMEAMRRSAEVLDGGEGYTAFITDLTESMAQVYVASEDDKPNRNLI